MKTPKPQKQIVLFDEKKVRRHWDEDEEVWYFSVVDVVEILTYSPRPRKYCNALKTKLAKQGSELSQKMGQLKLESLYGKTDTIWANQKKLSVIFDIERSVITKHIKNIFKDNEIDKNSTCAFFAQVQIEGGK